MNWKKLDKPEILAELTELSYQQKVLIFKHSTRCAISTMALSRLERAWQNDEMTQMQPYFLDLLNYRALSNQIAEDFGVEHQSPQVLVIEKGKVVFHNSHNAISYQDLQDLAH
ncbi:MAG: bacillithiol system redox-active protein YtxJ [Microscillaceae bacterium]|jgi:bacillithiol system protein YtxJ|nr:bacillithiol system redox-active protein YtxJ [Microscillaceae bacterium]